MMQATPVMQVTPSYGIMFRFASASLYHSNVVLLKSKFWPDIIPKIAI